MISLAECRKLLGEAASQLSDAELEQLRQHLYGLADIAVTCFLETRPRATATTAHPPLKEPSG